MKTKLTLKLDKNVIIKAKEYAASQHRSLSGIIEDYLQSLVSLQMVSKSGHIEISDFVKSMSVGSGIPGDVDHKAQYSEYLEKKYR